MGDGLLEERGLEQGPESLVRRGQHTTLELTNSNLDSSSAYSYMTSGKLLKPLSGRTSVRSTQTLYNSWHSRSLINNASHSG